MDLSKRGTILKPNLCIVQHESHALALSIHINGKDTNNCVFTGIIL